ncbi:MAG: hypothetical protein ACK5JH_12215 [Anaerocolumna sp.]
MKKKNLVMIASMVLMIGMLGGCKSHESESILNSYDTESPNTNSLTEDTDETKETTDNAELTTDSTDVESDTEIPMVTLPEGITGMKAEISPSEEVKNIIIEYMEIPDDFLETTHYYYNYVDLDDDGTNEIFVVVIGNYTSGTGGSSALILKEQAGRLHVAQDLTLVNTPVIISDETFNGYHNILIPYYGNDISQYSLLTFDEGEYVNVPDGLMIESLEGITGKAIIANDFLTEMESGIEGNNLKN